MAQTPQQRKEHREWAHNETYITIINDEHMNATAERICQRPNRSIRDKAGMLKVHFADLRDYNGSCIGRYANFMLIASELTAGLPVLSEDDYAIKYASHNKRLKRLAEMALAKRSKPSCPKCGGDYAKGDTHCMHCGFYLVSEL